MRMFHSPDPQGVCCDCRPHPCCPCPVSLKIEFDGPVDDDVRLDIDGRTVQDEQRNIGWYDETQVAPFPTIQHDLPMRYGAEVKLFCFDGWKANVVTSTWTATILWSDNTTTEITGGTTATFPSVDEGPPTGGTYWDEGPWFFSYYDMGSFFLEHPTYGKVGG